MIKGKNPKSVLAVAQGGRADDLHHFGFIDKKKMRKIEALCLTPVPDYTGERIKAIRSQYKISQAVLASVLNISLSSVRQWEIGEKHPCGPSLKLLDLLERKGLDVMI